MLPRHECDKIFSIINLLEKVGMKDISVCFGGEQNKVFEDVFEQDKREKLGEQILGQVKLVKQRTSKEEMVKKRKI